jgi:general secretion pathway protein I
LNAASCEPQNEAGFTLIEAVVALALLAVMLSAIGSVVAGSRKATRTIEEHVASLETARMVSAIAIERNAIQSSDFAGEVSGHSWHASVLPLSAAVAPVEGSPWIPRRVMVRVKAPSGALVSVETVRLQRLQTRPSQ